MAIKGEIIDGKYEILKQIGQGGMSLVYLAMDNRLNKSWAVKEIRKEGSNDYDVTLKSLLKEANLLKELDHPTLPRIVDIIDKEGTIYVVMDYIEGQPLNEVLDTEGAQPQENVIEWAKELCEALEYLHTRKPAIIYRDMKPANVMLKPEGRIKLIDFGIAREYKAESMMDTKPLGTEGYAAPEQYKDAGKQSDARTDIYCLGATLYHLVTGQNPYGQMVPIRQINQALSGGLEKIILKCTQREPEKRYQSCAELLYALEHYNEIDDIYRKKQIRKLTNFSYSVVTFILFLIISLLGLKGVNNQKLADYMTVFNRAENYKVAGQSTEAIRDYEAAIAQDGSKSDAYIGLLNLYVNNNDADNGIAKIEGYINKKIGKVDKNDQVLFKLAMTYFDIKKDYGRAYNYFKTVNAKNMPEAAFYTTLAYSLKELNPDYARLDTQLGDFEKYNDSQANNEKKISNYMALANVYISYKSQLKDANTKTINIDEKSKKILEDFSDEKLRYKYEIQVEQQLAQAYRSRGLNNTIKEQAKEDYLKAIECNFNLLQMEETQSEKRMIDIALIYKDMDDRVKAIEQFQTTLKKFPQSIDGYVKYVDLLMDIEMEKPEGQRVKTDIVNLYNQLTKIPNASSDEGFKKLARRLKNADFI